MLSFQSGHQIPHHLSHLASLYKKRVDWTEEVSNSLVQKTERVTERVTEREREREREREKERKRERVVIV